MSLRSNTQYKNELLWERLCFITLFHVMTYWSDLSYGNYFHGRHGRVTKGTIVHRIDGPFIRTVLRTIICKTQHILYLPWFVKWRQWISIYFYHKNLLQRFIAKFFPYTVKDSTVSWDYYSLSALGWSPLSSIILPCLFCSLPQIAHTKKNADFHFKKKSFNLCKVQILRSFKLFFVYINIKRNMLLCVWGRTDTCTRRFPRAFVLTSIHKDIVIKIYPSTLIQ